MFLFSEVFEKSVVQIFLLFIHVQIAIFHFHFFSSNITFLRKCVNVIVLRAHYTFDCGIHRIDNVKVYEFYILKRLYAIHLLL